MSEFLEFFVLWDIHKELGESVQNKFTFIDEDVDLILQEFFAIVFHLFRHSGAEHHDLFLVWSFNKDFLNVGSHASAS